MKKFRNSKFVASTSWDHYSQAISNGLMQVPIQGRKGKQVLLPSGQEVTEFINCSYLGLDVHPKVIEAYRNTDPQWGVNFCCARSRFSIAPLLQLEEELSQWYGGRAVTFPSVTTTHLSAMPLLASGVLIDKDNPPSVRLIFDRFAHSSMQYLKPVLAEEAAVETIAHNDFDALKEIVIRSRANGEKCVYIADGIYSMGGVCPIKELLALAEELDFYLYIDDAHGTTIFGDRGEGPVLEQLPPQSIPDRLFLTFSLTKGFGAAGGGILVSNSVREQVIRNFGQIYAFSAPLDFASIQACFAILDLHRDGTVQIEQENLRKNVSLFDSLRGEVLPFSPIRMVKIGNETQAIEAGRALIDLGFFVSTVFFPVVPRGNAQLRICLASNHTEAEIRRLIDALETVTHPLQMQTPLELRAV